MTTARAHFVVLCRPQVAHKPRTRGQHAGKSKEAEGFCSARGGPGDVPRRHPQRICQRNVVDFLLLAAFAFSLLLHRLPQPLQPPSSPSGQGSFRHLFTLGSANGSGTTPVPCWFPRLAFSDEINRVIGRVDWLAAQPEAANRRSLKGMVFLSKAGATQVERLVTKGSNDWLGEGSGGGQRGGQTAGGPFFFSSHAPC